jgi:hypothetical protein
VQAQTNPKVEFMGERGPKPGTPKPIESGRKAGTPNKITLDLVKTLREMGFDPAAAVVEVHLEAKKQYQASEEVLAIINEEREQYDDADEPRVYVRREVRGRNSEFLKVMASTAAELMSYTYPKRKALDRLPGENPEDDGAPLKQVVLYVPSNGR